MNYHKMNTSKSRNRKGSRNSPHVTTTWTSNTIIHFVYFLNLVQIKSYNLYFCVWLSLVQHCICEIHIAAPSDSLRFHWYMVFHCMNLLQLKFYSIHSTVEIFTTINNSMRTLLCVIFIVVKHTYFPFYSFLNIKSSGIKYIHNIVQLSPQFISRTFSYLFDAHMWVFLMGIYLGNAGSHCIYSTLKNIARLPWWLSGKESTCQCRRHRFDP